KRAHSAISGSWKGHFVPMPDRDAQATSKRSASCCQIEILWAQEAMEFAQPWWARGGRHQTAVTENNYRLATRVTMQRESVGVPMRRLIFAIVMAMMSDAASAQGTFTPDPLIPDPQKIDAMTRNCVYQSAFYSQGAVVCLGGGRGLQCAAGSWIPHAGPC